MDMNRIRRVVTLGVATAMGVTTYPPGIVSPQTDPATELREEIRAPLLKARLEKFGVIINLDRGNSTDRMAIAPIRQSWVNLLKQKGEAILGVVYTTVDLKMVGVGKGLYLVFAKGDPVNSTWVLLRPDGSSVGAPIKAVSRSLTIPVAMPRAILLSMSPERGCFEDDGIVQCGDF